jgi:RNA polymerase sigma factor (sigma-70 family)
LAPVALGAAVLKEGFDLLHARSQQQAVLAYLRAAAPDARLDIQTSSAPRVLSLRITPPGSEQPGARKGATNLATRNVPTSVGLGDFCKEQREGWLSYALALTRNMPAAEEAVAHGVQKLIEHHDRHGTLPRPDPVGWTKLVIRNYYIDSYRRRAAEERRHQRSFLPAEDFTERIEDQDTIVRAMRIVTSLDEPAHMIAMLRLEGLSHREIARQLEMTVGSVRKSWHRIVNQVRQELGVVHLKPSRRSR